MEEVTSLLVDKLEGLPIWGHPRTADQRYPAVIDPEHHRLAAVRHSTTRTSSSDDTSYGLALTEASVAAMVARLIGYDAEQSAGVLYVRRDWHDALRH